METSKFDYGIKQAVEVCMAVKPHEKLIIITDKKAEEIGQKFKEECLKITDSLDYFIMENFGKRPLKVPNEIYSKLEKADACFFCKGEAVEDEQIFFDLIYDLVAKSNLRMATMPGITKEIVEQGMNADYKKIHDFSKKLFDILHNCKKLKVKTERGTDFDVEVGKYKWIICDGMLRPNFWTNLPDGEVFTAPVNSNGKVIIDGVLGDILIKYGNLEKNPLYVSIKDNRINECSCENKLLEQDFLRLAKKDENAARIGEIAMGTNLSLDKIIGNLLQDEKFPSVHLAFGDSYSRETGTDWKSDSHVDGVILRPDVWADSFKVMERGNYLI